jgi:hypothetical protein
MKTDEPIPEFFMPGGPFTGSDTGRPRSGEERRPGFLTRST